MEVPGAALVVATSAGRLARNQTDDASTAVNNIQPKTKWPRETSTCLIFVVYPASMITSTRIQLLMIASPPTTASSNPRRRKEAFSSSPSSAATARPTVRNAWPLQPRATSMIPFGMTTSVPSMCTGTPIKGASTPIARTVRSSRGLMKIPHAGTAKYK